MIAPQDGVFTALITRPSAADRPHAFHSAVANTHNPVMQVDSWVTVSWYQPNLCPDLQVTSRGHDAMIVTAVVELQLRVLGQLWTKEETGDSQGKSVTEEEMGDSQGKSVTDETGDSQGKSVTEEEMGDSQRKSVTEEEMGNSQGKSVTEEEMGDSQGKNVTDEETSDTGKMCNRRGDG